MSSATKPDDSRDVDATDRMTRMQAYSFREPDWSGRPAAEIVGVYHDPLDKVL